MWDKIIDQLEAKGLIERRVNRADRAAGNVEG
jgi:DNA-binding MarR family transcriptional regulator